MATTTSKPKGWVIALCPLIFFLTGLPFLSYPGLQQDELLFAAPLYRIQDSLEHWRIFHRDIPIMTMTYVGALKSWLCAPILRIFGPSAYSIRVPALLLGSLSVWLFFVWLDRTLGRRAAWIGSLLLATDTSFLLTTCFDWGPVALQHLLTLAGLVLLLHFHHHHHRVTLAAGFFCFGLALWDKALFLWIFIGLVCGLVALFPRDLLRHLSPKNLTYAMLAFILGAFPLIAYNVRHQFPTLHAGSGFSLEKFQQKTWSLRGTWKGQTLFGYIVNTEAAPSPRGPRNGLEALAFWLHARAGNWNENELKWAAIACALLLIPMIVWTVNWRFALFCLIVMTVAWLEIAITRDAGATHHVILLWPFPHALLAAVFGTVSLRLGSAGRWLLIAAITLLVSTNLLVTNQYLYQLARFGAHGAWSDASYSLAAGLRDAHAPWIAVLDWGITNPLDVLDQGRLPLAWAGAPFDHPNSTEKPMPILIDDPTVLWVGHTEPYEEFEGVGARLNAFVHATGLVKVPRATYTDSNGQPVFQAFYLVRR